MREVRSQCGSPPTKGTEADHFFWSLLVCLYHSEPTSFGRW